MSTAAAKVFRQQILKPADGVFLVHARAIERLIEEQLGAKLQGVSVPDLPYYLMPRADFLYGLESENAEALSVIEGLRLPNYVVLLPSPPAQRIEEHGLRPLRHDYWARTFEAEVARAWQNAREDNHDVEQFGAEALQALIGSHAFAEVRDVLDRDGVILPVWEDDLICRSFVAMVVRLKYFAPGSRGFFFPATRAWAEVDQWLAASGLDLPEPLQNNRLPMLLTKSRPGAGSDLPATPPLLPLALPYAASDPDLPQVLRALETSGEPDAASSDSLSVVTPSITAPDASADQANAEAPSAPEQSCLDAIRRGLMLRRRRGWLRRAGGWSRDVGEHALLRVLLLPGLRHLAFGPLTTADPTPSDPAQGTRGRLSLHLLERAMACAQRAELDGRLARALRWLAEARRLCRRLTRRPPSALPAVERILAERESCAEEQLANLLAAKWKLPPATAREIHALVARLATDDRRGPGSPSARALLSQLDQVLYEGRYDYYRLRLRLLPWLRHPGRGRVRQVLPFQPLLKALRALETGRQRLEDLPWPIADLERFSEALEELNSRITRRLDVQIMPRLEQAMREADFVPRGHREVVAAQKMRLELLDVIKHRRHLKFTDARDIVARNILRLPDPTLGEFFRGDRLRRFDRTAARALPGVYRPGEFYIKGLQQLGAPLFGTGPGRSILRHLLLPFGGAYLVLKSLDLLLALLPTHDAAFAFTTPAAIILIGLLTNIGLYSGIGRHLARTLWHALTATLRFVLYDGVRQLLRWPPVAGFLKTGLARALGRNLVAPMLIGVVPLTPIIALAVLVEEVPIEPGLWLAGLAFALGTLARNTPAGRRFLDDLSTNLGLYLRRINQTLFIGLIQQLIYFFKEVSRRFSQLLHRVDEALTHHLGETPPSLLLKAALAPIWRLAEALIEFYVTVLVEPQINPVKHFPIVSIGHKLLLPFLPAITATFIDISESVLPKVIAYPLVTLTILLLPGLFGFLVWELKENWKLYQANHRGGLRGRDIDSDDAQDEVALAVEPATVGSHGEDVRALLTRGFHSGALPKGFDRLRRLLQRQIREQADHPKRLRRLQRQLEDLQYAFCVFFEREFTFALRERCRDPDCGLQRVATGRPRIASNLVELQVELHPAPLTTGPDAPLQLRVRLFRRQRHICLESELSGPPERLGPTCWGHIRDDLRLFAGRSGVDLQRPESALFALPDGPDQSADRHRA
ncbi:sulfite exporter TauE/SafE family protein [Thiohalocapsa marina]|uniref:sulfite exporter TauE/SafE family protein n=1 Tax=Thiohalocapsa marina TaxID=424902 RepID=UPI001B85E960|nr:sulfite exporter TauE/SafE family protein [Thiohalocapsa marina]